MHSLPNRYPRLIPSSVELFLLPVLSAYPMLEGSVSSQVILVNVGLKGFLPSSLLRLLVDLVGRIG